MNEQSMNSIFPIKRFRYQAILVVILAFALNVITVQNKYALDDGLVITENEFTQSGIQGLYGIFGYDSYYSYYKSLGQGQQLEGGRYRPLSLATFAVEHEIFGENPFISHLINVLLLCLTGVVMLYLLRRYLFAFNTDIALLATLLFIIHPIHSEVIANIKSRDELLSLFFLLLTFIYALRYQDLKKSSLLYVALLFYSLALFSKEYGVLMIVFIPVLFIIYYKQSIITAITKSIPYGVVAGIFLMIRYSIVGFGTGVQAEVLTDPFLFADAGEKLATKVFILGKYLKLLIFPHPLSYDYSFEQIAYRNPASIEFLISAIIYIALTVALIYFLRKRHLIGFALLFFLGNLLLVSNLVFDIGATMGERLLYHPSFGMMILFGWILAVLIRKTPGGLMAQRLVLFAILVPVIALSAVKTTERNLAWKNDQTLFIHDVKVASNSTLANGNAGAMYIELATLPVNNDIKDSLLRNAEKHLIKAVTIHPRYVNGFFNLGVTYFHLDDLDKCESAWNKAREFFPSHPNFIEYDPILAKSFFQRGLKFGIEGEFDLAINDLKRATKYDAQNTEMWFHLGGAYYTAQDFDMAREAWDKVLSIDHDHEQAIEGLKALGRFIF